MSVWDETHPKPSGGDAYERTLARQISEISDRQMQALVPHDAASWAKYREVVGGALEAMIGRDLPKPGSIQGATIEEKSLGDYRRTKLLLRFAAEAEELPAVLVQPNAQPQGIAIWIHPRGEDGLWDASGNLEPAVAARLKRGEAVLGVDLFGQGEFTADGQPLSQAPLLKENRWDRYLGYTVGYNPPLFAQRVRDILSAISFARDQIGPSRPVTLVGYRGAGHWAAAARALAGAAVAKALIDTNGFRFSRIAALDDPDLLPGGAKYLDLPGMLALSAPHELQLAGEGKQLPAVVAEAYRATGQPQRATSSPKLDF